jgi:3-hydroxy-9,10-secoandrosta-1,3,5(10)-triene-9,17-dione monooxygenase
MNARAPLALAVEATAAAAMSRPLAAGTGKDFSGVSYAEALQRATDLIPLLRAEAPATEAATRLTDTVLAALHESGLLRSQQPKAWGGMELDFPAFYEIPEKLGQGCASTAWVFANLASHHRQLVQWDPTAQEEIWGPDPDALIASGIAYVQGQGKLVDGGLLLSGQWGFSSGVDVSSWNMLACVVKDADGKPIDWCMNLVPREDYEIIDDWQTLGMRGTGSRTVRCEDVFVPQHRVLSMQVSKPGHSFPGFKVHTNPMFRVPNSALGGNAIAGAMIGNARAMLDETTSSVKQRATSYTGASMRDFPTVQLRVGMAGAKIDAAHAWLKSDCHEGWAHYKAGGSFDLETKLRYRRNTAMAMKIANEAVDILQEMAGASAIYDKSPLQRMFRDAHASAGHVVFSTDMQFTPWGLVALGGAFKSPTM